MVPNLSIVQRPAGNVVYVIKGNKAEARLVTTGNHKGTLIEMLSALENHLSLEEGSDRDLNLHADLLTPAHQDAERTRGRRRGP